MALSFSEKLRGQEMGKAFRVYQVTHDASATTIEANMLDLDYIEYAIAQTMTAVGAVADYDCLAVATGKFVTLTTAQSSGAICVIQAWGW